MDIIKELLKGIPLPRMAKARQKFFAPEVSDIAATLRQEIAKPSVAATIKPGMRIAIAVGSRGVAEIPTLARVTAEEIKRRTDEETIVSDLTYDLRSGDPDFIDKLVALTFGNMAYDAVLEGKTGLMSALVEGCYELMPIPDPKLGPRKLDVATTYNTERFRPLYENKRGLPIFLNRAS